jgi:hypothetical protein
VNLLNKIAKRYILNCASKCARQEAKEIRAAEERSLPKFELQPKHIQNAKLLLNRQQLLQSFPSNKVCAEIGVDKGEFSELILKIASPSKLHLIDAWGDAARYHDGLKLLVREKFCREIAQKRVEINVGVSTDVLPSFPDRYFDWVYLDTEHSYPVTAAELALLKNKVKRDGIIAGHDYSMGNWVAGLRYGVIEAVHELCAREDWEIIYLTCETQQPRSFAIRKIIS